MALMDGTRSQGISQSQFYLHTPRSSANVMNHTIIIIIIIIIFVYW